MTVSGSWSLLFEPVAVEGREGSAALAWRCTWCGWTSAAGLRADERPDHECPGPRPYGLRPEPAGGR